MLPAWPLVVLVSVWYMFLLPRLRGPYILADSFEYMGALNQVRWIAQRDVQGPGEGTAEAAWAAAPLGWGTTNGTWVAGHDVAPQGRRARSSARHPYIFFVLEGPWREVSAIETIAPSPATQPFCCQRLDRDHLRQQSLAVCGCQGTSRVHVRVSYVEFGSRKA